MISLGSHHGGHKYLFNAIDVFSKYTYSIPIRSKTAGTVASVFCSILVKNCDRRPLVVRTDKGHEFVNTKFRELLDSKGIEMRVCRNPDVKCAIVERFNRTLKSKLYKWFTLKNTYP
jgi:transposase InsO family protein